MWTEENGKLTKSYKFKDFKEAILFINEIAKICNEVNHHPEIHNCYNNVKLDLFTHDAQDKITQKDHQLALLIDKITI
tara:strand:- start:4310 stop:4543 length:234 start_codon:yes stop_codon:yes gene_type:complete